MNTFDVNRLSTVVYTGKCDILYTSFKNTQDINKSFLNVDKNALNMYIALYSYTVSTNTKEEQKDTENELLSEDKNDIEIITASIKNKRKLLIGHYKDIYITILITEMIKYYELEVLKKGIKRILVCMEFYQLMNKDYDLKLLVESVLKEVNIYKYFYKFDYINKQVGEKDKKVLIYDCFNRETVYNNLNEKLQMMVLNWIDYKDLNKLKGTLLESLQMEFYKNMETQQETDDNILNKTYYNLKIPIQYTYEVINEIIGLNKENVSSLMVQNEETNENIKIKNTDFFNKVLRINDENFVIWTSEGYVSFMQVGDIEMSIMKEYDDMILDRIKEYEDIKKRAKDVDFHYIVKKVDEEDIIYTNFNVDENYKEDAKWSLWLTKATKGIKNLSTSEYKKLFNHLLTISIKECDYEVKERMIKLKDYDLVIYLNVINEKFVMLVKDKDEVKDYLSNDVQEFFKKL